MGLYQGEGVACVCAQLAPHQKVLRKSHRGCTEALKPCTLEKKMLRKP